MPKKEKKRLQVVISDEQDALLTRAAYELSSPERLISKSEVVRLAIQRIAAELEAGADLAPLVEELIDEDAEEDGTEPDSGSAG
ncbi:MAG TPA: transcriptional regulator [Deinococcales bacterium]|nr:transcriptional regulator [Deinococcales bacterium]